MASNSRLSLVRKNALSIGLLLLLVVSFMTGCNSDDDKKDDSSRVQGVATVVDSTEIVPTPTRTPMPEVSSEALLGDAAYEMIYFHAGTLFHFTSDMAQPEAVEGNIHPASLALAPDYATLVFGIQDTEMDVRGLGILNLTTMATTTVELPAGEVHMPPVVRGWSANSEWVVLSFSPNNDPVIVLNVWTGVYTKLDWYSEEEMPKTLSVFWLTDNRLLVYAERDGLSQLAGGFSSPVSDIYIVDPATGEQTPITFTDEARRSLALRFSAATLNTLDKELQNQSLALAVPHIALNQTAYYPEMKGAAVVDTPEQPSDLQIPPCEGWDIQYKPIREAALVQQLYHAEDVTILSDLYLLPDESLVAAQWKSPNCDRYDPKTLTVELLHINSDGTAAVVASDVSYGWILDFSAMIYAPLPVYARSILYAASPDGRYVAWVKHDDTTSSIVVTDRETLQVATLVELNDADSITSVIMFRTTE
ncbi:MAG: hypothetical protein K8L91_24475 [Anaerolineae bacterium]|nr:hypothetical protein [Anaerolineae bacterium]